MRSPPQLVSTAEASGGQAEFFVPDQTGHVPPRPSANSVRRDEGTGETPLQEAAASRA
jgi:hypothetical protein